MSENADRIESIFAAAVALPVDERDNYLDAECANSPPLRQQIDALLRAHDKANHLLDRPAAGVNETALHTVQLQRSGEVIAGRYKLLEQVGAGGMGAVWLAEQKEPVKRKVAIKLVKAGMDTAQVLARFEAERQALALMDHPNIAKVFDGGMTEQGRPYFVMEFVKGVPLTDYCNQSKLSLKERLNLFIPVCQAVQHAHQKGVIHRDLKPSNILICLYDGKPVPKVIDFGLAKAMHYSLTDNTLHTAIGMMVGTPLYMSPEQAEYNNLDVDTRSDIYSLGVILYELLTGSTPLEQKQLKAAAYNEVLRLIKEVEPPKPSTRLSGSASLPSIAAQRSIDPKQLSRSLTGDLDWIVMKALDKERGRRYETANGLARDVERFLNDEAVEASPPSSSYRLKKLMRKHRTAIITAAAFAGLLILGMVISVWLAIRATNAEKSAEMALASESQQSKLARENEQVAKTAAEAARLAQEDATNRQKQAEEQRGRAEQREQDAINAVKRFGDAVSNSNELKNNPALESLRKELLREPLGFFQSLRTRLQADASTRPESLARLAIAIVNLGDLTDEIGDKQNALKAYTESLEIRERLARENPSLPEFQRDLAASHNNIGLLLSATGKPAEALTAYEQARAIQERLTRENPTVTGVQNDLAASHLNIGVMLAATGKPNEALTAYEQAQAILERIARENPTATEPRDHLSGAHHNIGFLLAAQGKPNEGLAACEQARSIRQRLARENPTVTKFQRDLAVSHSIIGTLLSDMGKPIQALAACEQARTIQERLARENSSVNEFQNDLAITLGNIGIFLSATEKQSEALDAYEQALAIQERLARENPTVTEFQNRLAGTHCNIGTLLNEIGKPSEAKIAYEQARTIGERLARENPTVIEFQGGLAGIHSNLAGLLKGIGKPKEALAACEQACAIQERLARESPSDIEVQIDLATFYGNLGVLLSETGKPSEALINHERARAIQERVARENPTAIELQNKLSGTYHSIAELLTATGEPSKALAAYEQARAIRERLVQENPSVPEFQSSCGATLNNIAMLQLGLKHFSEARDLLRVAIKHQKLALTTNPRHRTYRQFLNNHYHNLLGAANGLMDSPLAKEARRGLAEVAAIDPQYVELDAQLRAVLDGKAAKDAAELCAIGRRAYDLQRFAHAARFLGEALERDAALAEDRQAVIAYHAACSAALAANGQDITDLSPDESVRQKRRAEAFSWLSAELDRWDRYLEFAEPQQRQFVAQTMKHWQTDVDLAGIRDEEPLKKLPEKEREDFQKLWKQVDQLRTQSLDAK